MAPAAAYDAEPLGDASGIVAPQPGSPISIVWTKWGGGAHWTSATPVTYLGEDQWGWWYGQVPPTRYIRPGADFDVLDVQVGCFARDRGYSAAFYLPHPGFRFRLYVDVTTQPSLLAPSATVLRENRALPGVALAPRVLHAVDLDLDVIDPYDGETFVDDEDEFSEHQARYGYPSGVVSAARSECDHLVEEVRGGHPRFAQDTADRWRAEFARLAPR